MGNPIVLAAVYGGLCLEAALRFAFPGEVICDQLPFCTGIGVLLCVIRHILTAANVSAVFLRLLLFMVAGLHIQLCAFVFFKIAVILFALIPGVYANSLDRIPLQILHERNKRVYVVSVGASVLPNSSRYSSSIQSCSD